LSAVTHALTSKISTSLSALALAASERQLSQLVQYVELLAKWNHTYNLTAVRDVGQMATLHIADCLAAIAPLRERMKPGERLLDVGTGGGLPGVVIAIMLPDISVTLNDTVLKKCAFLRQAKAALKLDNVEVIHARVEEIQAPAFNIITSRAFSDINLLVELTSKLLSASTCYCAMKGVVPTDEIARLPAHLTAQVQPLTVPGLDAERCLVWITRLDNPLDNSLDKSP
jgi:16S rRNA (guanine527-N7)-methyltransferase